jgi:hypothetical protein
LKNLRFWRAQMHVSVLIVDDVEAAGRELDARVHGPRFAHVRAVNGQRSPHVRNSSSKRSALHDRDRGHAGKDA